MSTVLGHDERRSAHRRSLEAEQRDLTRAVLSLICSTTGRRRTPEERARLDGLVREIDRVRSCRGRA